MITCRLVDQAIQAAVGDASLHLFADAPPHKTPLESGGPVEAVATPGSGQKQQHQHRKRKERHESFNSQSQERKVIRYHHSLICSVPHSKSLLPRQVHHQIRFWNVPVYSIASWNPKSYRCCNRNCSMNQPSQWKLTVTYYFSSNLK
jgi:hypothetical protein